MGMTSESKPSPHIAAFDRAQSAWWASLTLAEIGAQYRGAWRACDAATAGNAKRELIRRGAPCPGWCWPAV